MAENSTRRVATLEELRLMEKQIIASGGLMRPATHTGPVTTFREWATRFDTGPEYVYLTLEMDPRDVEKRRRCWVMCIECAARLCDFDFEDGQCLCAEGFELLMGAGAPPPIQHEVATRVVRPAEADAVRRVIEAEWG